MPNLKGEFILIRFLEASSSMTENTCFTARLMTEKNELISF